jgi:hypothetical protein
MMGCVSDIAQASNLVLGKLKAKAIHGAGLRRSLSRLLKANQTKFPNGGSAMPEGSRLIDQGFPTCLGYLTDVVC